MSRAPRRRRDQSEGDGLLWAPVATLLAGLLAVILFIAALPHDERPLPVENDGRDAAIRKLVEEQAELDGRWGEAISALCNDTVLQAEGLAPDCLSGAITFGDALFDDGAESQLTEEGIRKLHLAIAALLRNLRSDEAVWNNLESIELRGHADPRARRDPYVTNMRVSQRRPMSIMFYLISDWALSERDRTDLQQLLVLSAASHSRPPKSCPERSNECFPFWRRVEIIPRAKDAQLRRRLHSFLGKLQDLLPEPVPDPTGSTDRL